jgi:hypothetical protein
MVPAYTVSSKGTLAEESRYGYTHTQYEADDKSYQNDNDQRLCIDVHGWYPFNSDPDGSEEEQSIN